MNRANELKNARYRTNKANSDVALKRLELAQAERLAKLEVACLAELKETPDTLSAINEVVRNYRRKKSELRAR